ncbi:MAG: DUF1189 domain-containing protein [Planctomycetes bacterium]|nr:DUF1189 domain-containing protein [Planctomycetota bacterium]
MPQPFPNHLVSIPQSIVSLKHYFRVHDQSFGRTALYGLIIGALVAAVNIGGSAIRFLRMAPVMEARQAAGLAKALAAVSFKDGEARSDAKQPAIVWEDAEGPPETEPAAEGEKRLRFRIMLAVLDTTGAVATPEKAAEFAGCPAPRRVVVFGQKAIISAEQAKSQEQGGGQEAIPYTDQARLADLKKLIEEKGGKFPDFTLENGLAKFKLEADKVHLLVIGPELLALVDTTGKDLAPRQAWQMAAIEKPSLVPPEFLLLITATEAALKSPYEAAARTLEFAGRGDLSPELLARWAAATARKTWHDAFMGSLLPQAFQLGVWMCVELLFIALVCSVAGLIVSALTRAGLPYAQLFTVAVYAMTPARLLLGILIFLSGLGAQAAMIATFAVGMGYTAAATYRTARELGATPSPQA